MDRYSEFDFSKVKGFSKLSVPAQEIFKKVYALHSNVVSWIPVSVKERKTYVEVKFDNGEWLHYLPNGTWY